MDEIESQSMSVLSQKKQKAEAAVLEAEIRQQKNDSDLVSAHLFNKPKNRYPNIQMEFPSVDIENGEDDDEDLCEVNISEVLNYRAGRKNKKAIRGNFDL